MPEVYANMPDAEPRYSLPVPSQFSYQKSPLDSQIPTRSPLSSGGLFSGRSASSKAQQSDLDTSIDPFVGRPSTPVVKDAELEEDEAPKATRPEVRFWLPRAHLTSSIADTAKDAEQSSVKLNVSWSKTDSEIMKANQKLHDLKHKKEAAAKAGDHSTVADMDYYAIPDLQAHIDKLQKEQHKGKKKRAAHASQITKDKRKSYRTEVETESEHDDDDDDDDRDGSKIFYG